MNNNVEKMIGKVADKLGMTEDEIRGEMREYLENGFREEAALVAVQGDHSSAMRSVPGTFELYTLEVGDPESQELTDREGNVADHTVMRIIGLMRGVVERGGPNTSFITTVSLWDDRIEKAKRANLEDGKWYRFKGFANTRKGTVSIGKDDEFQEWNDGPDHAEVLQDVLQNCTELDELLKQDDRGNYVYHKQDVLIRGFVSRVPTSDRTDRLPIEISGLATDPVTVWPPDDTSFGEDMKGEDVLVYGYHQVKDGESSVSANIISVLPTE